MAGEKHISTALKNYESEMEDLPKYIYIYICICIYIYTYVHIWVKNDENKQSL